MKNSITAVRKALVPLLSGVVGACYMAIQHGAQPKDLISVGLGALVGLLVHQIPNDPKPPKAVVVV